MDVKKHIILLISIFHLRAYLKVLDLKTKLNEIQKG